MLEQFEEIAVLEEGDDGAIVSIRGQGGPSILLGPGYLGHLGRVVRQAAVQLATVGAGANTESLRLLCLEMQTLLRTYNETCNKYEGGRPTKQSLAEALEELEQLRRNLALAEDVATQAAQAAAKASQSPSPGERHVPSSTDPNADA